MEDTAQATPDLAPLLKKSLELHGVDLETIEQMQMSGSAELEEFMVQMKPTLLAQFENDEVHVMSILNTLSQLGKLDVDFEKVYPNFMSPPINPGNVTTATKKKTTRTPRETKPSIELPVEINWDADTKVPVRDFIAACRELESTGVGVGYPYFEEHKGWKKGIVDNVINGATGLTASQFVRNQVWKEENIKNN